MLSRVAENLYWMARYMERAENTARLINAVTLMMLDMPRAHFGWDSLIKITGLDHLFFEHYPEANEGSTIRFLLNNQHNPSSIIASITRARENTRSFREILPWESWEWVNELYLYAKGHLNEELDRRRRYEVLQGIIRRRQSILGLLAGTMSRDPAFQFLRIGRSIERADMTSRVLDVSHVVTIPYQGLENAPYADLLWMNILKALSAYQMFRRQVGGHTSEKSVACFLLKEVSFPRTVMHCLIEISDALHQLPQANPLLSKINRNVQLLAESSPEKLANGTLHDFIDQIQRGLIEFDADLRAVYFRLPESPLQGTGRCVEFAS